MSNPHMDSNKYRRVQAAIIDLDDAARNELDDFLYKTIRERVLEPINSMLFMLHQAYENGRQDSKPEKPCTRVNKTKKNSPRMLTTGPNTTK